MNKFKISILFLSFLTLIFVWRFVLAAEVYFVGKQELGVGSQFKIDLIVDAPDEAINAVEGSVTFERGFLGIKEISDGDSIINFWVQKPKLTLDNQISFSGITVGGYKGKGGKIFSVIFQSLKEGETELAVNDLKILLNDGRATAAQIKKTDMEIKISNSIKTSELMPAQAIDNEAPETFMPEIANDPNIFDGQWFLVFATQDKNSGIDRYEVNEGGKVFMVAESPYLLKNQNLDRQIFVKAVDKSGNERTIILPPKNPRWQYKNYLIWLIIILIMAAVCVVVKKFYGKKKNQPTKKH
jgi:hypothetical protein